MARVPFGMFRPATPLPAVLAIEGSEGQIADQRKAVLRIAESDRVCDDRRAGAQENAMLGVAGGNATGDARL